MIIFAQVAAQALDKAAEHFVADPVAVGITGNSNHMLLGYDHGMGVTWDGGRNWYHPDELPLAQLYQVGYDMQYPYNVYGGLQDNGSVRGPSSKRGGAAITFEEWTSIAGNLPNKAVNVVIEDAKNPNLLFAGVDFGLYVTIDGGKTWTEMKGLPTQPVYDLEIHPRENELIAATHGRGFFITDISPLQELDQQVLGQDIYLFDVKPQVKWVTRREPVSASINFRGPSAPAGMVISYYEKAPVAGEITVQIMQGSRVIAETKGPNAAGLNQVIWTMRINPTVLVQPAQGTGRGAGRGGGGGGAGGGFGGRGGGAGAAAITSFGGTVAVQPGEYTIVVRAGGKTLAKKTRILEDVWFDKVF